MKVIEGIGVNGEMELNKEKKNIIGITQSGLILVLVVLIVFMMVQINRLQGTARVINYAGLVKLAEETKEKKVVGEEEVEIDLDQPVAAKEESTETPENGEEAPAAVPAAVPATFLQNSVRQT